MKNRQQHSDLLKSNMHLLEFGKNSAFTIKRLFVGNTARGFFNGLLLGFRCLFSLRYRLGADPNKKTVPAAAEESDSNESLTEIQEQYLRDVWVAAFMFWLALGVICFLVYSFYRAYTIMP
jgi:hypothetical protein